MDKNKKNEQEKCIGVNYSKYITTLPRLCIHDVLVRPFNWLCGILTAKMREIDLS